MQTTSNTSDASDEVRAARPIVLSGFVTHSFFLPVVLPIHEGMLYRIGRYKKDMIITFVQPTAADEFIKKYKNGFTCADGFVAKVAYHDKLEAPVIRKEILADIKNNGATRVMHFKHRLRESKVIHKTEISPLDKRNTTGPICVMFLDVLPVHKKRGGFNLHFKTLEDAYELKKKFDLGDKGPVFDESNPLYKFKDWAASWTEDPCGNYKEELKNGTGGGKKTQESVEQEDLCAKDKAEELADLRALKHMLQMFKREGCRKKKGGR